MEAKRHRVVALLDARFGHHGAEVLQHLPGHSEEVECSPSISSCQVSLDGHSAHCEADPSPGGADPSKI